MNLAVEALGATFTSCSVFTFFFLSGDTPKYVELICLCFEEKQDKGTEHYCVPGVVALCLWDLVQPTALLGYVVCRENPRHLSCCLHIRFMII